MGPLIIVDMAATLILKIILLIAIILFLIGIWDDIRR